MSLRRMLLLMLLALLPVFATWPSLVGFSVNPIYLTSGLATGGAPGLLPGVSTIDLDSGVTAQALGRLSADQWLEGHVPWWNTFSGIGLPLAGEMQSSALFLPFILLLHFDNGIILLKLVLQSIAGLATYALLRELKLGRIEAFAGGMLYSLCGTFAWFGHAPMAPVAFLPLFLLGIERARFGGWRVIAVSIAYSLYAGFPETAYLDGLLALAWAVWRFASDGWRLRFAGRVALGGLVGLLLAAPALWSFVHLLLHGTVGNHAITESLFDPPRPPIPASVPAAWLMPYVYGPLANFSDPAGLLGQAWPYLGGYIGVPSMMLALAGLWGRRLRSLRMVLLGWIVLCIGGVCGVPVLDNILYALPMTREVIMARYSVPSWNLAAIVLAALAIQDWRSGALTVLARRSAAGAALLLLTLSVITATELIRGLAVANNGYWIWPLCSLLWALSLAGGVLWLVSRQQRATCALALVAVLGVDATTMFAIPLLSGPRKPALDWPAINFLKANTGLQRFYSMGPYRANYGAYFGTAQINHEYTPLPENWVNHVATSLDPSAHPIMFRGDEPPLPPGVPSHADQLVAHLKDFEQLAVRFVVVRAGENPFLRSFDTLAAGPQSLPHALMAGDTLQGVVDGAVVPSGPIGGMGLSIGTYGGQSDGALAAELCAAAGCSTGTLAMAGAADNGVAMIPLDPPLPVRAGESLRWRILHAGGTHAVAAWMPMGQGASPQFRFTLRADGPVPALVYRDGLMNIYELPDAAPYFEILDGPCHLQAETRLAVNVACEAPATLIRRELFFPGWRAGVNETSVEITPYNVVLQQIALPAGASKVRFAYAPPYLGITWATLALGVLLLLPLHRWRRLQG